MSGNRIQAAVMLGLASGLLTIAACAAGGAAPSSSAETATPRPKVRELIHPTDMGYSNGARYGDLVWTAGHLPFQADSSDPFDTQVEAVLDNLEATLEEAGAGFDTVLKTNVYLVSMEDWPTFNEAYVARLGQYGLPPRTTVEIAGLGLGRIEIEMVAHVRQP